MKSFRHDLKIKGKLVSIAPSVESSQLIEFDIIVMDQLCTLFCPDRYIYPWLSQRVLYTPTWPRSCREEFSLIGLD